MHSHDPTARLAGSSPSPEAPRAILLLYHGNDVVHTRLAPLVPIVIGRDATADVVITNASASKRHARLTFDGNRNVLVEDLGSTNGTIFRGHSIQRDKPVNVGHGAELYFGEVLGIVHIPGEHAAASPEDAVKKDSLEGDVIADAPIMKRVLEEVAQFGPAAPPVVVTGETGTGKEEIAKLLHRASARKNKPLIVLNCAAIPAHLLESMLFGHEKGAFTGASAQSRGYFEEAHGGTLFLDEIGELPPDAQKALLRVLETGKISRVGSVREIDVSVRLIAATWRDLKKMCEEGTFRWDLYHRLSVLTIQLPPLRERREDIPKLVGRFLQRANKANGRSVKGIEEDAVRTLMAYDWPGNIRELRNWIERAVVVARGEKITLNDLPAHIDGKNLPHGRQAGSLDKDLEALEREKILEALRQTDDDTTAAAKLLNVELRTLQRRMQKYGITSKRRGKK